MKAIIMTCLLFGMSAFAKEVYGIDPDKFCQTFMEESFECKEEAQICVGSGWDKDLCKTTLKACKAVQYDTCKRTLDKMKSI